MISYEEARAILLETGAAYKAKVETTSLEDCIGRVCAVDIQASLDIQPFNNSAMDGFAVRLCDLKNDGDVLTRSGMVVAGAPVPDKEIQAGTCVEIMTGAPVPPGTEAVVPVELVEIQSDKVRFKAQPNMGANIRRAGEDFKKGMEVLKAGQTIYPQHIMPLASLGIDKITVHRKLRAVFLATGNELVNDLSQDLKSGQVYNSNRPYGVSALEAMGIECIKAPSMQDDPDQFEALLNNLALQDIDFIVSSGAVSAGKFDFVRKGLEKAGAEILFHKVKVKPGKPNLFARLPNGMLYFGLPGNPVATAAGLRFFVQPALRAIMEIAEEKPVKARATTSFKKRGDIRMFLKALAKSEQDGGLSVDLLEGQASFMVRPFLNMNCWAIALEGVEEIKVGDMVELYSLYPQAGFL